ncbi:MAG: cysteine--tRNA ligase [Spirochaetes bacterium]|nr:MAG: cysteine--tRNA ligase [Spirochaetota bacterium]
MKIYDTMVKGKVDFIPLNDNKVGIYLCGPTVYDYGHLGHGRSAIVFDMFRRYLIYKGYDVTFVRNWTDIDDKTIDRANKEGISVKELTERFIQIYKEDYSRLNILEPDYDPKPTEHIPEIIGLIERLFANGHAYNLDDGVYYDISTFPEYGKLSGQSLEELKAGARIEVSDKKKNPGDFALWKFEKPGEPSWDSPWGRGRPGWHIECSAMSVKYLGEEFDVHCGGQDLIFPHHEDEIAQSRGAGYRFANHWMHNGFLNIDNEKMSKSLGNFFTLREIFEKYSPRVVRYFLLSAHYKAPLNYSEESLKQAGGALSRYDDFILRLNDIMEKSGKRKENPKKQVSEIISKTVNSFEEGMDDDLNISKALAAISELVKEINILIDHSSVSYADAESVTDFMKSIDSVLGIFKFDKELLPEEIERLIEERAKARKEKDFKKADEIRAKLLEMGIVLEDTKDGTRWKRIK